MHTYMPKNEVLPNMYQTRLKVWASHHRKHVQTNWLKHLRNDQEVIEQ